MILRFIVQLVRFVELEQDANTKTKIFDALSITTDSYGRLSIEKNWEIKLFHKSQKFNWNLHHLLSRF
jgi:uncharacterized GH25 family protein